MGPFYCPSDQKVYIDLAFYRELKERFGAPGDFAQAYVIAHEVGHHVQNLLGISDKVQARAAALGKARSNALSVRLELQADCYAGVWGITRSKTQLLEPGDVDEALERGHRDRRRPAAEAGARLRGAGVLHARLARRSAQQWFRRGFESGNLDACDTFSSCGDESGVLGRKSIDAVSRREVAARSVHHLRTPHGLRQRVITSARSCVPRGQAALCSSCSC